MKTLNFTKKNPEIEKEATKIALELIKTGSQKSTETIFGFNVFIEKEPKLVIHSFKIKDPNNELVDRKIFIGSDTIPPEK